MISVALGFLLFSAAEAGKWVQRYGYYCMAVTVAWWGVRVSKTLPAVRAWALAEERSVLRLVLFTTVGLTILACATVPYSYKVLYDELVLQATAWNMHFFREVGTVVRGYPIEGVFSSLDVYLDKRPYFFPFTLSLLHDLTGYRELNGYLLNTVLLPCVLILFYAMARTVAPARASFAALVCFGASSLLAQNANGVGMELMNLAMLLACMLTAVRYLSMPDGERLSLLILTTVLLAQTRYESSLYVLSVAMIVLEGWRRAGRLILPPAAILAPILLIPCALHNTYLSGTPVLWELREDMDSRFGGEYFLSNLSHAATYFFSLTAPVLNSVWLSVLGGLSLGLSGWALVTGVRDWRRAKVGVVAAVCFAAAAGANLLLLMFYFWGQLDDPIVARLVLPFLMIVGLSLAWVLGDLHPKLRKPAVPVAVAGALLMHVGVGLSATAHHLKINQLATELSWESAQVDLLPPRDRLVITNKSALAWIMKRVPAIRVERARSLPDHLEFHLRHGTFHEVLVTQYLTPTSADGRFIVETEDALPESFILETIAERRIGPRIARISRLVEIRPSSKEDAGGNEVTSQGSASGS